MRHCQSQMYPCNSYCTFCLCSASSCPLWTCSLLFRVSREFLSTWASFSSKCLCSCAACANWRSASTRILTASPAHTKAPALQSTSHNYHTETLITQRGWSRISGILLGLLFIGHTHPYLYVEHAKLNTTYLIHVCLCGVVGPRSAEKAAQVIPQPSCCRAHSWNMDLWWAVGKASWPGGLARRRAGSLREGATHASRPR